MDRKFSAYAATEENPNGEKLPSRQHELYSRRDDVRSPFARDYTRILHSMAYRRLKHKTQVFFNINNDHICTRMEHVNHVESVSYSIAKALGLNVELTKAISMGHDLGHAPFGHQGEVVIKELSKKYLEQDFWHEQNGLRFVDKIELLEDNYKIHRNLDLTYAVRDGIISHCGEVDQNGISPRNISIPIEDFDAAGKYQAVTWEGCVVKMADKIAYVGRDIEDAINLGFLGQEEQNLLLKMARAFDESVMNTTVIMHNMIIDICQNSSPETGICMSTQFNDQLQEIKDFNYRHIYQHKRFEPFKNYSKLVITQIFDMLRSFYDGRHTWANLAKFRPFAPKLVESFESWLAVYCSGDVIPADLKAAAPQCENEKIYQDLQTEQLYIQAVIDYISGMTDRFAIAVFNELLEY
ncbi:MAG: HD domain-containing protein [Oscillospiraceae bacterium]|nr:HD domain-containing protein [Oscillospiraceae bacterium]